MESESELRPITKGTPRSNATRAGRRLAALIAAAVLTIQSSTGIAARLKRQPAFSQPGRGELSAQYGNLPLAFELNTGQTDPRVRYLARGGGMTAFFTDTEAALVLSRRRANQPDRPGQENAEPGSVEQAVVRMKLEKSSRPRRVIGMEKLPGISNYFLGNNPAKWHTDVPHYGRIRYEGVYPGIDLVWYGNQRLLEYDFVVSPGADPKQIQIAYEGAKAVEVAANGDLVLHTGLGEVRQQKPRVYQQIGGKQREVAAGYAVRPGNRIGFDLATYDRTRELRIDPVVLVYSSYLGGSGSQIGRAIAVDAAGSAYVTGYTGSTSFPEQSPYVGTLQGGTDVFITKLTPSGNALVYSTYLGGSADDSGWGIAVDGSSSAYVTGKTLSSNFPTQSAYQSTSQGDADAFVTKLAPAGDALVYSTYLGGSSSDNAFGIAVDGAGSAYVTGQTLSTNFPTQSAYGAVSQGLGDVFVTKLTPSGTALVYSTYLGGSGVDYGAGIAVDGLGSAYVTGSTTSTDFPVQSAFQPTYQGGQNAFVVTGGDAFVVKLTPAGNALVYSTYLGGSGVDYGAGIAVDASGSAYVTGTTNSANFPTRLPFQAALLRPYGNPFGLPGVFATKLAPSGDALVYSTYLSGSGYVSEDGRFLGDNGTAIAVDGEGSAYVTGNTSSSDFPTQSPYQATFHGGPFSFAVVDAFVTKLSAAGDALSYSTFLGGTGLDFSYGIAVDQAGSAYVTGLTVSTDFPTLSPYQAAFQGVQEVFVTKLAPSLLGLRKTHSGNFTQGQNGATFSVVVSNDGAIGSNGTVTVTDSMPPGLALVSMAGTGWTCPSGGNTCTRLDALAGGSSYPAITVTVNVAANAASPQVNLVSVTAPGSSAGANATDSATINPGPALDIAKTHRGYFTQGQANATYTLTVSNQAAAGPPSGTVTVTETLPGGLMLVSMDGIGWTCTGNICTRTDSLAGGLSYPPITVGVNVASNAPSQVTNQVSVSGGGSAPAIATDPSAILPLGTSAPSDFNGDGQSDVMWQDPVSGLAQVWFLGGAQGTTTIGAANLTASNTWRIVGVGDFNCDGRPDVVWQDPVSGAVQVWFLGGAQGNIVTGAAVLSLGNSWRIMSVADFNGDGQPDCIWQDHVTGLAQIWFMGGAQGATVIGAVNLTQSNTWRIAGTGDFNGDGRPDVLWQDPVSGATQVWYLGGAQGNVVTNALNLAGSNSWRIASVADFNGDGRPDVVLQDPVSGASQVWFLGGAQGTTITGAAAFGGANAWRIAGPR